MSFPAKGQEVEYISDKAFMEKVEKGILELLKSDEVVGVNTLKKRVANLKEHAKVDAKLVPQRKKKLDTEELYRVCKPSSLVVAIYETPQGATTPVVSQWASASALTEDGICLTNYHVMGDIIGGGQRRIFDPTNRDSLRVVATAEGKVYPIVEILSYDFPNDMVLFRVDTRGDKLQPLPLGEPAPVGKPIHLIAHPDGRLFNYGQGIVTRNTSRTAHGVDTPKMEISIDFAKGSSGGAILDDCGNLVGMVSFSNSIYFDNDGKMLQMHIRSTIPVGVIKRFFQ